MSKISALTELAEAPASTDEFVIVDKSDTTMATTGTTKRIQSQYVTIADASTTVKGKVELATDAEAITGTDTVRAVTPSNLTAKMDADGTLAGNSDTRIPSQKAVKTYADTKTTLATVLSTISSGWTSYSTVTPTYTSADAPTYTITFAAVDLTSTMSVGMRVKLTDSTVKYFIITAIAFSTNTVVTLYGGTDYTLSGGALSSFNYSSMKAPLRFPLDPTKWTVETESSTESSQSTPTQSTWYNIGSINIVIPIGIWDTYYYVGISPNDNSSTVMMAATLSTANNSESDADFTSMVGYQITNATNVRNKALAFRRKTLVAASKTTYYLNEKTETSGAVSLLINETYNTFTDKTIIRAVCAYL